MGVTRDCIPCPKCNGRKFEPSAITICRTWCSYCGGDGYFQGTSHRLMTVHEYIALNRKDKP